MSYAIIRVEKVKSLNSVRRTLLHSFRLQDTPNANPHLTQYNKNFFSSSFNEAMLRFYDLLPKKSIRKDAVLLCEYIVTASPEYFLDKSPVEKENFFRNSVNFLSAKHKSKNIVLASIHFDESSPHMHVYVVPNTEDGRLSCKDFFGSPKSLNRLQDDFYEHIIKTSPDLERGIKNTKIRHTDSKVFAHLVNSVINEDTFSISELVRQNRIKTTVGDKSEQKKAEQAFFNKIKAQQAKTAKLDLEKKAANDHLEPARKIDEQIKPEADEQLDKHSAFIKSLPPYTVHADRFKKEDAKTDMEYKPSVYDIDDEYTFSR